MKVLVTGATGFIGNYVIEELLRRNSTVVATSTSRLKALSKCWYSKVVFKEFTFSENISENLFDYFEKPDLLIHLAWQGLPNYKDDFHITLNLPQQKVFIENLLNNGLNNLAVTGTCFEYGMQEGELIETMEAKPENAYAIAKNNLRIYVKELQSKTSFSFKWIRLFYMYGEGQNEKSLVSQLNRALEKGEEVFNMSGGEQTRDFLPVEEVAKNLVKVALQKKVNGIVNICSGKPIKVKDFVDEYLLSINRTIKLNLGYYPYVDFEPFSFWGNNNKFNSLYNEIY